MSSGGMFALIANDGVADKLIMATDALKDRIASLKASVSSDDQVKLQDIVRSHRLFVYSAFRAFVPFSFEYTKTESSLNSNGSLPSTPGASIEVSFTITSQSDFISDPNVGINIGEVRDSGTYRLKDATVVEPSFTFTHPALAAPIVVKFSAPMDVTKTNLLAMVLDYTKAEELVVRCQLPGVAGVSTAVPWVDAAGLVAVRAARNTAAGSTVTDGEVVYDGTSITSVNGVLFNGESSLSELKLTFTSAVLDGEGAVIPTGTALTSAIQRPWLRYCDFPGHRLIQKAAVVVGNNTLDEYTNHVYNLHEKCMLSPGKREVYSRMVGHALPKDIMSTCSSGLMKVEQYSESLQAPRAGVLPAVELFVPLLFWYRDMERAFPASAIPFADRKINLTVGALPDLVSTVAPSNSKVHSIDRTFTPGSKPVDLLTVRSLRMSDYDGTADIGHSNNTNGVRFALYNQNIYLQEDVGNMYIGRAQYNLIRCNRLHRTTLNHGSHAIQVTELRWPTEYMVVGALPSYTDRSQDATLWHRYQYCQFKDVVEREMRGFGEGVVKSDKRQLETRDIITKLGVSSHGNVLLTDTIPVSFLNSAIQYNLGRQMHANRDSGLLYIPFCVKPEDLDNPSGHINLTRLRETYLNLTADLTLPDGSGKFNAELVIMARALNLLTIANGSAILRYTN